MHESFSADPFEAANAKLRASTADRDEAARRLGDAYAAGKLDDEEYRDRLDSAMAVKTLGELPPLLGDLGATAPPPAPRAASRGDVMAAVECEKRRGRKAVLLSAAGWVAIAAIFNVVWLLSRMGGVDVPYWPIWPMFGFGIGAIGSAVATWSHHSKQQKDLLKGRIEPAKVLPPDQRDPGVGRPRLSEGLQ